MKKSNPPVGGCCLVPLDTEYYDDGKSKKIYCPRCGKVYIDKEVFYKKEGDE